MVQLAEIAFVDTISHCDGEYFTHAIRQQAMVDFKLAMREEYCEGYLTKEQFIYSAEIRSMVYLISGIHRWFDGASFESILSGMDVFEWVLDELLVLYVITEIEESDIDTIHLATELSDILPLNIPNPPSTISVSSNGISSNPRESSFFNM